MEGWTSSELVGQADKQTEEHEEMLHADSNRVDLLGWRLSALDFVAGFIVRGGFIAVFSSRGVRSRATVRVGSRAGVRGTGISSLSGTTRRVRFITAGRVLQQSIRDAGM